MKKEEVIEKVEQKVEEVVKEPPPKKEKTAPSTLEPIMRLVRMPPLHVEFKNENLDVELRRAVENG